MCVCVCVFGGGVGAYYGWPSRWPSICLSVRPTVVRPSVFSFPDYLRKCLWIVTKLDMCIDIVKMLLGITNGQISSIL